jgi:hypothetical protein
LGLSTAPEVRALSAGHREPALPLKSGGSLTDASHMPTIVTMTFPSESDQPGSAGDGDTFEADPATLGSDSSTGSDQEAITPEQLTKIIRNMETGFYDTPEVREHIARRIREELGP